MIRITWKALLCRKVSGCDWIIETVYGSLLLQFAAMMALAQPHFPATYGFDSGRSTLQIDVLKGGLFGFLGHDHTVVAREFSGTVQFNPRNLEDSSVSLSIESASLTVLDPGASQEERLEVQTTMAGPEVLDARAFPKITFSSTRVKEATQTGDDIEIKLAGRLNLHGNEKEITLPVRINVESDLLRARGTATITQTDFGIVPVKAGGGTVRVKDTVKIDFDILAEKKSS
jgi:polyisoprenoid-binding protein YceI